MLKPPFKKQEDKMYALVDVKGSFIIFQSNNFNDVKDKLKEYFRVFPEVQYAIVKMELIFSTKPEKMYKS